MTGWMDRVLAALGLGGRKPEANVAYGLAETDRSVDGAPKAARVDQGTIAGDVPRQARRGLVACKVPG
jgi:hypothetical protein